MFGAALLYYAVRFIIFASIAGLGLFAGAKLRKMKQSKN